MSLKIVMLIAGVASLLGVVFGYFLRWIVSLGKKGSMELEVKQMILDAKEGAQKIIKDAEKTAQDKAKEITQSFRRKEDEQKILNDRLVKKEEFLDRRQMDIDKEIDKLKSKSEEIKDVRSRLTLLDTEKSQELERIATLSKEEAKEELVKEVEKLFEEDMAVRIKKLDTIASERMERRAKEILTTAIHRFGNSVAADVLSTAVNIPSDDVKGKIIGKEGRNIKSFERATGVEVIVDDTPGAITLSSFDPVRRQVARFALENLILDGRIQPARIEDVVEKAKQEVNKIIKEKGEQAAYETGIYNIDQRLLSILGRLHFRTSYGQNVLQHSTEMAHIAGMIAEELGANVQVAKAGALFHDIGKALDHEVQGTHVEIGRRILQKFGVDNAIIKAMQSHHEEYPYETTESVIVQVADAISGGRPGARRDSVENYLKRLGDLEAIAESFEGIDKAYALQAGREIRIFVKADKVSDVEARKMAREAAIKIERELKYPGEIKVVVIRETRIIEHAR